MRGAAAETGDMFSYLFPEQQDRKDQLLRAIRVIVELRLEALNQHFKGAYSGFGSLSIPLEQLLRALLLQVFCSIRSERQLFRQLNYNLLFRWFFGLDMETTVWVQTVFSKNRGRLLDHESIRQILWSVVEQDRVRNLLSEEHFSVDGTLLEAWASQASFQPRDHVNPPGNGGDFRRQCRSKDTHESLTDPDVRLHRKIDGEASRLAYLGRVLMQDELGGIQRVTLGADEGYDRSGFVQELRNRNVTPHVACKKRGLAIDGRITRHKSYHMSIRLRGRIASIFGWICISLWPPRLTMCFGFPDGGQADGNNAHKNR